MQTYVRNSQQNVDYGYGKNAASAEDVYIVLPLDWNNESYYRIFVDSEEMKKCAIAFYD